MGALADVSPAQVGAKMHRALSEPGSANKE
jgi:hypothetical protein